MDRISIYLILVICCVVHCKPQLKGSGGLNDRVNPSCIVKEEKSGKDTGCIFPFQFEEKMYYGCTEDGFKAGEEIYPWCSTKVNPINNEVKGEDVGKHVSGGEYYGNCAKSSDNCPMHKEAFTKLEILESLFFPNPILNQPPASKPVTRTNSFVLKPIDNVASTSEECREVVEEYEDSNNVTKTVNEKLQKCILKSQFGIELNNGLTGVATCEGPCKCIAYQDCNWSNKMLTSLSSLANNDNNQESPIFKTGLRFFNNKVCDYNKKHVYCCNDNQHPSDEQVEKLKVMDPCVKPTVPTNEKDSGKWKPDGFKGECGTTTIINNILSGKIAKNGEFPYMALISNNGQNKCGGSLINKRYILTAAHCVQDYEGTNRSNLEVALGDYVLNKDPDCTRNSIARLCNPPKIVRKVKGVVIHENYDPTNNYNNIALIRLEELVPLHTEDPIRSIVAPICLPWLANDHGRDLEENDGVLVSGWGQVTNIKKSNSEAERTLRKELLKIADKEDCTGIQDNQICAASKRQSKDSCTGDSGGPLVSREYTDESWYQVGIRTVPQGTDCQKDTPGIYTKVEEYLQWIEDHLDE